jgi:hypothetical protein
MRYVLLVFSVTLLSSQLAKRKSDQIDLSALLSDILKQEPIDMPPEEVDYVIGCLADGHKERGEMVSFLHRLMNADSTSASATAAV